MSQFPRFEEEILTYWKEQGIFERSIKERPARKTFVFYDGPPFATGLPHFGHLLQSSLKDAVPRYWTMKGYRVPRRWGWDCHGLPIENMIEKELGLHSKKHIEEHGIDKFNSACHASVFRYEGEWGKYIDRIGRWVDFKNPYMTLTADYIESVWWVFSELYKKELVYRGTRVSLFCPRCSTPLSNFEVAMENTYVDREDPAVYVKFPIIGEEKTYFLAWTTTPWTLPANAGLAVNPDLVYVKVRIQETGDILYFAESRAEEVLKEWGGLDAGVAKVPVDVASWALAITVWPRTARQTVAIVLSFIIVTRSFNGGLNFWKLGNFQKCSQKLAKTRQLPSPRGKGMFKCP